MLVGVTGVVAGQNDQYRDELDADETPKSKKRKGGRPKKKKAT